jgi:isoleucyl-tRNA synthetase
VLLRAGPALLPLLEEYAAELPGWFIVSQVALERGEGDSVSVEVGRAAGLKCERCWKYSTEVGSVSRWPTICPPCAEAVGEMLDD